MSVIDRDASGQTAPLKNSVATDEPVGLIAGWGKFPVLVATAMKRKGYQVHCLAVRGHADPVLEEICDKFQPTGIARAGSQIRFFRRNGVQRATMAGKIFKTILFEKFTWFRNLPDLTFLKHFLPVMMSRKRDSRDDALLGMIVDMYGKGGIDFVPATDFAPELLVPEGILTQTKPTQKQLGDIDFGWQMARQMGRLDIGQSVVVKSGTVLAVEAIEGTDECIRRAGTLCTSGGFTVVKVSKPNQDMRFDVPAIGVGTIETIHKSGGRVLAIEADKTLILDQEATIDTANRLGIAIVSTREPASCKPVA